MNAHAGWCALLWAIGAAAEPAWDAAMVSMPAVQVGPHSWYVEGRLEAATRENQGFMSNAGFVITTAGVVVFDALGSPALAARLLEEIKRHTSEPVRRVIISHYHADHVYGIAALRAAGAEVWAQQQAGQYLHSAAAERRLAERRQSLGRWLGPEFQLPLPDRWLTTDETFDLGGVHFSVQHIGPAHSPEDLAKLVLPDNMLFAGDTLSPGRVPFIGEADTGLWVSAIDRILGLDARVLVPGHGPASQHPARDLQLARDYLEFLRLAMARSDGLPAVR